MTAYADTDKAVRAIKAGAIDFIPKPWEKRKTTCYAFVRLSNFVILVKRSGN